MFIVFSLRKLIVLRDLFQTIEKNTNKQLYNLDNSVLSVWSVKCGVHPFTVGQKEAQGPAKVFWVQNIKKNAKDN
jgi:hypothetical protein